MAASDNQMESQSSQLYQRILQKINQHPQRKITFADFMEAALYEPTLGYYATRAQLIGQTGDFFTAPHLAADFGELLAEQFVQMWSMLGQPALFTLIEMGAGQGLLAVDILRYLLDRYPEFCQCLDYQIVERSQALIALQQQHLRPFQPYIQVRWSDLTTIPTDSITGCFFSNELVDAFPVHRVRFAQGHLWEIYVTTEDPDGQLSYPEALFREVEDVLSTPELDRYFSEVNVHFTTPPYPEGYTTEVNLSAIAWLEQVARCLHQGFVLTIDYGYSAERYYHPVRSEGTLQCYYRHRAHGNPYLYLGQQDITAHVDFTTLEQKGMAYGLQLLGRVPQSLFLMALGLGDRIAALSQSESRDRQEIQAILRRREALHSLINSLGMGNFWVMLQGKALPYPLPTLKGLESPDSISSF